MINKTKKPYDNIKVISITGDLLFYCSNSKKKWYLKKNLANEIEPNILQLNFQHSEKFRYTDPYYREAFRNKCVCCGTEENLTIHHVVPPYFRRHLPGKYKDHMSHDLLPICREHHDIYEEEAQVLKDKLIKEYYDSLPYSKSLIFLCYTYSKKTLPEDKKKNIYEQIISLNGTYPTGIEEYFSSLTIKNLSSFIINKMNDVQLKEFVIMWRRHFIGIMSPKFLPEKWNVMHMV